MKITILTLFPEMFKGPFDYSILKRAQDKKTISIDIVNIRDFGIGKHKIVDDKPYGGGAGMILRADVVKKAIDFVMLKKSGEGINEKIILLDAQGQTFSQKKAQELTNASHLILIAGHYEGVDERVREFADEELSIGDYVLTGGEIPAMVVVDSVARLLPNVLGKSQSSVFESFQDIEIDGKKRKALEYPQYTRPEDFEGHKVPKVLLSGNHKEISDWRKKEAIKKTKARKPMLLES